MVRNAQPLWDLLAVDIPLNKEKVLPNFSRKFSDGDVYIQSTPLRPGPLRVHIEISITLPTKEAFDSSTLFAIVFPS
jgi:hypothetical protein